MATFFLNFIRSLLIVWFSWGAVFDIPFDPTQSDLSKFEGILSNVAAIIFLLYGIFAKYKKLNYLYYAIGTAVFCWYIYYTPIDISAPIGQGGYTDVQKTFYVTIDYIMLFLVPSSMAFSYAAKIVERNGIMDIGKGLYLVYRKWKDSRVSR